MKSVFTSVQMTDRWGINFAKSISVTHTKVPLEKACKAIRKTYQLPWWSPTFAMKSCAFLDINFNLFAIALKNIG